jgi:uncharacterized membrane protein YciS (DUF1049 family)
MYTANVIAVITVKDEQAKYTAIYRPITFTLGGSYGQNIVLLYVILGIVAAGFLIACLLFGLYYWKYRKTEQRLDYELSDVRNVAGIHATEMIGTN